MEPKEFGCHEEDTGERDDDSLIEKCWVAQYKGDSRKWLIRDASYKNRREPVMSCMKTAYTYPPKNERESEHVGKRKRMLLQKFYEEASVEVISECNASPPVEDYCTEYDGNYKIPGFKVEKEPHTKFPELYEKYPLYGSLPTTYYSHNVQNQYPKQYLGGHTTSTDHRSPFRRSSLFTTPVSHRLQDTNL